MEQFGNPEDQDLRDNMAAAAHLIHGSADGRFTITYAVKNISKMKSRILVSGRRTTKRWPADRKQFAPYLDKLGSDRELEKLFLEFLRERVG